MTTIEGHDYGRKGIYWYVVVTCPHNSPNQATPLMRGQGIEQHRTLKEDLAGFVLCNSDQNNCF